MSKPENGFSTEASIVRIVDGDTIVIEVKRQFPIRIRGLRCAEHNTDKGKEETAFLHTLIKPGDACQVFIPSNNPTTFMDFNSFNRLIGDLYIGDILIAEYMIKSGHGIAGKKEGQ